jgi:two-component system NarL family sensor kinase
MRNTLFLICIFFCIGGNAQDAGPMRQKLAFPGKYEVKLQAYLDYLQQQSTQSFDNVVEVGADALLFTRKNGDSTSVGRVQRIIGEAYYFKGDYAIAAQYFYGSIQQLEKSGAKLHLAYSYNALAKLYRKTRDLPRALTHYEKALALFRTLKDTTGISMILNESGVVYEYAGDYNAAIEHYNASLTLDRGRKDSLGQSYALANLAGVYLLQKKYAESLNSQLESLSLRRKLRDTFTLALNFADLAELYLAMHFPVRAQNYVDTSQRIAVEMGYLELQLTNLDLLSRIAEAKGNAPSALSFYRQRSHLQDSIFSLARSRQIEELNARYEALKKEQTISAQQYELGRKNLLLVSGTVFMLLAAGFAWNFFRRRRMAQEARLQAAILQQQELSTRAILEAEEAERQRIAKDLHDGVGQMMSAARMNISALAHRLDLDTKHPEDYDRIIALIDESCKEVRSVSHNMMPNALLKNSLAAAVREFIDKIDHKALQVHLYTEGLDERLDANVEIVLYRVIQECVNNVIKHAGANTLDISIVRDATEITATVEDNGHGFTPEAGSEGMGLRNIRTRVGYLKGSVEFNSRPGKGTLVALQVPLS